MNSFEKGHRRVPVSMLQVIAQALETMLDALVARDTAPSTAKKERGPQKKIQQQLERIEALPKAKQRAIAQILDSMLQSSG